MKPCTKCGQLHPPKLPCHLANASQDSTIVNNDAEVQQTIQNFNGDPDSLETIQEPVQEEPKTLFTAEQKAAAPEPKTLFQPEQKAAAQRPKPVTPKPSPTPVKSQTKAYQVPQKTASKAAAISPAALQYDAAAVQELGPGVEVGGYLLEELLGHGGMGEVWRGVQPQIKRKVAIKILDARLASDQSLVTRFLREAQTVNEVHHRNLVDIYGMGQIPGINRPYLVMEYLEGRTLHQYLQDRGQMPLFEILPLLEQICDAIGAAHQHGVVHRDLKPENIFLTGDKAERFFVKVLDFGVAKARHNDEQQLTQTGEIFGTAEYMSPEQCMGAKKVDQRSDLYALGIIVYEMICGRTPFADAGEKRSHIWMKHVSQDPPLVTSFMSGRALPPGIDQMLQKALAKEPDQRYQSASELFEAFRAVAHNTNQPQMASPRSLAQVVKPKESHPVKKRDSDPPKAVFLAPGQAPAGVDLEAIRAAAKQKNQSKNGEGKFETPPASVMETKPIERPARTDDSEPLLPAPKQGFPIFYLGLGIGTALAVFFLMFKLFSGGAAPEAPFPLAPQQSKVVPAVAKTIATSLSTQPITQEDLKKDQKPEVIPTKPAPRPDAKALEPKPKGTNIKEETLNPFKKQGTGE